MNCGHIYKIEFPNGKHYIGLTTSSLEQRRREHKCCAKSGDQRCLYKALRKYNMVDIFELIQIDTSVTLEELCEKEIHYIQDYNSYYMNRKGYNMTFGGDCGANGYVYTEDVRQKISERQKKYHYDNPDARQKVSELQKKHHEENPDRGKNQGEKLKKYHKDNKEATKKYLDTQGKNKPFDVFTKDGIFIKTFSYQFESAEYLQKEHNILSTINICDVLAGRTKSSAGFIFRYK